MKATPGPKEAGTVYLDFVTQRLPDGTEANFSVTMSIHSRLLRGVIGKAVGRAIAEKRGPTKLCHGAIEMLAVRSR